MTSTAEIPTEIPTTQHTGPTALRARWMFDGVASVLVRDPLVLQAATALDRFDIVSLRVDAVGQGGAWPLVTVSG